MSHSEGRGLGNWPNFHYPKQKDPEYVNYRQEVTVKYGEITTIILIGFLVTIPIYQSLITEIHRKWGKVTVFKHISMFLSSIIEKEEAGGVCGGLRVVRGVAQMLKKALFKVFYHSTSILVVTFWVCVLFFLSLTELNDGDLFFLAKRLGRVAAVCLPTILFLSLRPSPLPRVLYLALIPIHRWISRIVIIQSIVHALIYCQSFRMKNTWFKAVKPENAYGWVALLGFAIIGVTSVQSFKNRYYKAFYFLHYFWTWIVVICLQFHIRPVAFTPYTTTNLLILFVQIVYRLKLSRVTSSPADVKVHEVSPGLCLIELPNYLITQKAINPGAHIRVTTYASNFIVRAFKQIIPNYHPYTLATLPLDNSQKLIIRRGNFKFINKQKYIICGSYDPKMLMMSSSNMDTNFSVSKIKVKARRVLIVIGGSAISFALPILRVMNYHGIPVKVVWVIRDFRDVMVLKFFDGFIHGDDFEIFVTGEFESILKKNDIVPAWSSQNEDGLYEETTPLLPRTEEPESDEENVDISVDSAENDEDDECNADFIIKDSLRIPTHELHDNEDKLRSIETEDEPNLLSQQWKPPHGTPKSGRSRKVSLSKKSTLSRNPSISTMNDSFIPILNETARGDINLNSYIGHYNEIINSLNLLRRIYKGRPKIDHKYQTWCISSGFTQCSGPMEDSSNNLVCCRDVVPQGNAVISANDVWVISAGPKSLVGNIKLWANENGFNFHEESFHV